MRGAFRRRSPPLVVDLRCGDVPVIGKGKVREPLQEFLRRCDCSVRQILYGPLLAPARGMNDDRTLKKLLLIAALGLSMIGCADATDRAQQSQADRAGERARQEERNARESAKRAWEARLTQIENKIQELKAEAKPQARKARKATEEAIDDLEVEAKRMRTKISTLDEKADKTWDQVKDATESALGKLERKLSEWRSDLKNRK